jgi:predicted O-methyltransferase YrrM
MGLNSIDKRMSEILACFYRTERAGAVRLSDGGGPFGFDVHTGLLFEELALAYRPTAIVETGCFLGDTTAYLAGAYSDIPIFTCDIDAGAAQFTESRLRGNDHVTVKHCDSPGLVTEVSEQHSQVLFFLDAHWAEQWPLARELSAIRRGIAVVHDFDIGHPRFDYDEYDGVRCGPDLLKQLSNMPDAFFTPDPDAADYPIPCLQVGRRAGVGIVPIGVGHGPLDENPHLTRHSLSALRGAETAAS